MVLKILTRVFSRWQYFVLATLIAWVIFTAAVLVSNVKLIYIMLGQTAITLSEKVSFVFGLYGTISTNFSVLSAVATVVVSLLVGINLSLLIYYIRRRRVAAPLTKTGASVGFLGMVSGFFGIGCAACGSVIVTGFLTSIGALGLLAFLPFHGAEFGMLAILLLSYSLYELCKRIADPLVCPV